MLEQVQAGLTILVSLTLVLLIIAFSWWFMWKVFLSRFEFINEIFFPDRNKETGEKGQRKESTNSSRRKIRKE